MKTKTASGRFGGGSGKRQAGRLILNREQSGFSWEVAAVAKRGIVGLAATAQAVMVRVVRGSLFAVLQPDTSLNVERAVFDDCDFWGACRIFHRYSGNAAAEGSRRTPIDGGNDIIDGRSIRIDPRLSREVEYSGQLAEAEPGMGAGTKAEMDRDLFAGVAFCPVSSGAAPLLRGKACGGVAAVAERFCLGCAATAQKHDPANRKMFAAHVFQLFNTFDPIWPVFGYDDFRKMRFHTIPAFRMGFCSPAERMHPVG